MFTYQSHSGFQEPEPKVSTNIIVADKNEEKKIRKCIILDKIIIQQISNIIQIVTYTSKSVNNENIWDSKSKGASERKIK